MTGWRTLNRTIILTAVMLLQFLSVNKIAVGLCFVLDG